MGALLRGYAFLQIAATDRWGLADETMTEAVAVVGCWLLAGPYRSATGW